MRDEDDRADAGAGGGRGDGVGQVAGGGAGEDLHAELAGGAEGTCDHPVLEGVGRVARVVLHPELAQAQLAGQVLGVDEPGVAGLGVREAGHVHRDGQQWLVAPDVLGTGLDLFPRDGRELVPDLQRTEALHTGVERAEFGLRATGATAQVRTVAEGTFTDRVRGGRGVWLMSEVPFSSSPGPDLGAGRIWHRSAARRPGAVPQRGGLPGLQRAVSLSPSG